MLYLFVLYSQPRGSYRDHFRYHYGQRSCSAQYYVNMAAVANVDWNFSLICSQFYGMLLLVRRKCQWFPIDRSQEGVGDVLRRERCRFPIIRRFPDNKGFLPAVRARPQETQTTHLCFLQRRGNQIMFTFLCISQWVIPSNKGRFFFYKWPIF